ncbi:uncharacterized protein TRIADDRAFT_60118 [Trichoplax adhaerens]|uniref:C-type lectin domain-containing protein n=1 Tax=Trichoplax adhaerens TaxID=10228 RepID=B3S7C6_TRIAD|nr:hypothetical protein TRIADDRAFT_60118 [Trichoplax adhaerens]EDV21264.1 hypothetical protein TRIADDRAFT_60118 [Trichoplax adhaerens]|eukprot:XP_002116231.1 hypothetical protein TRIADDRAFT_60118 [Trichoplax adhaerens]
MPQFQLYDKVFCIIVMTVNAQEECADGWTGIADGCFKGFSTIKSFDNARTACQVFPGGDLAVDNTPTIHGNLDEILESVANYWIGLKDRSGYNVISDYYWMATGRSVTTGSQFWKTNYPMNASNRCVHIVKLDSSNFYWRDDDCATDLKYICQRPISVSSSTSSSITCTSSATSTVSTSQLNSLVEMSTSISENIILTTTANGQLDLSTSITVRWDTENNGINLLSSSLTTLSTNTRILSDSTSSELELLTSAKYVNGSPSLSSLAVDSNIETVSTAETIVSTEESLVVRDDNSTSSSLLLSSSYSSNDEESSVVRDDHSTSSSLLLSNSYTSNSTFTTTGGSQLLPSSNLNLIITSSKNEDPSISSVSVADNEVNIFLITNKIASDRESSTSQNHYSSLSSNLLVNIGMIASSETQFLPTAIFNSIYNSTSVIVGEDSTNIYNQLSSSSFLVNVDFDSNKIATMSSTSQVIATTTLDFDANSKAYEDSLALSTISSSIMDKTSKMTSVTSVIVVSDDESFHDQSVLSNLRTNNNSGMSIIMPASTTSQVQLKASDTCYFHISSSAFENHFPSTNNFSANDISIGSASVCDTERTTIHHQHLSDLLKSDSSSIVSTTTAITATASTLLYQPSSLDSESHIAPDVENNEMITKIQLANSQFMASIRNEVEKNKNTVFKRIDKFDANLAREIHQANITTRFTFATPQSGFLKVRNINAFICSIATIKLLFQKWNRTCEIVIADILNLYKVNYYDQVNDSVTVVVRSYNVGTSWAKNNTHESNNDSVIISTFLSCSVYPLQADKFALPVHFYFKLQNQQANPPYQCTYWEKNHWSEFGMELLEYNSTQVHCTTVHFTNFAVLMQRSKALARPYKISLRWITYIGCSISLLALLIMITIFISIRKLDPVKSFVHLNLAIAMAVSICGFLVGIRAAKIPFLCTAIAIGLHFFYLASLTWMMMAALTLLQKISSIRKNLNPNIRRVYFVLGWAIYINSCWIRSTSFQMWFFVGPVIIIFVVQDYFRRRFKFGSMIFPANYMGNIGRDTRADNKHFSWKAKIPLVAVSTGNASRECRDSGRCSPNLNEMAASKLIVLTRTPELL